MAERTLPIALILVLSIGATLQAQVDADLELGQRFKGAISHVGDADYLTFRALAGQVVNLKVKGKQQLRPYAQLFDASTGNLINTFYAERGFGTRRFRIKNFVAPNTAVYLLKIMSSDGSLGSYTCSTSGKLVRNLHRRFKITESFSPGEIKLLPFDVFAGAKLSATLKPTSGSAAFPSLSIVSGPQSDTDTADYTTTTATKVKLKRLPLFEFGPHVLVVQNVGQAGSIKTTFKLKQPTPPRRTFHEGSDQDGGVSGTLAVQEIEVLPEQEPNDDLASGQFSGVLAPGKITRNLGEVSSGTDADVYRFQVEGSQVISVLMLFDAAIDLDIDVYDGQTGSYIGSLNSAVEPEMGSITYDLAAGETALLDLVIYRFSGLGGYLLRMVSTPPTAPQTGGSSGPPALKQAVPSSRIPPDWVTDHYLGADQEFMAGEFIVMLEDHGANRVAWAQEHGLSVRIASPSGGFVAQLTSSAGLSERERKRSTLRTLHGVRNLPSVKYAEPNFIRQISAVPNDPLYGYQWHYSMINLPQAWDLSQGSADVIVAVIDTGILAHPDLDSRDTGTGYDMISSASMARDGNGQDSDPTDPGDLGGYPQGTSSWHGTHVAGTVGAESNNGQGVSGVDWLCGLMHIRVLGLGGGTDFDIAEGIAYAGRLSNSSGVLPARRADVINLSLGGPGYSQYVQDTVNAVRAQGVVIVAAAGNANSAVLNYPASYDGVISVSALDYVKNRAPYSSFGSRVDVAAPGGNVQVDLNQDQVPDGVVSTLVDEAQGVYNYDIYNGTSQASPHVAGVCALLLAVDPSLTPGQVENLLVTTAEDLGPGGRDDVYGFGLIDAYAALLAAGGPNTGGADLSVSPLFLDFGPSRTSQTLSVVNAGGGNLFFTVENQEDSGGNWLRNNPNSGSAPAVVTVSVVRGALSAGVYTGTVTVSRIPAGLGTVTVSVRMEVVGDGNPPVLDMGPIYVVAVDPSFFTTLAQDVTDQFSPSYAMSAVPVGQWLLVAGPDLDNDGFICGPGEPCGAYPTLDVPNLVPVFGGATTTGIDFVVGEVITLSSSGQGPSGWPPQGLRISGD